jgi:hypothetical protein
LKRNTKVRTLKSIFIDYKRANNASTENINIFFDRLDDPVLAAIPPEHFYNANEFGFFQKVGDNSLRIEKAYQKQIKVKNAHNLQWITIIECTFAIGGTCPSLVIFSGKHVQQQWFPNENNILWNTWYFTTFFSG